MTHLVGTHWTFNVHCCCCLSQLVSLIHTLGSHTQTFPSVNGTWFMTSTRNIISYKCSITWVCNIVSHFKALFSSHDFSTHDIILWWSTKIIILKTISVTDRFDYYYLLWFEAWKSFKTIPWVNFLYVAVDLCIGIFRVIQGFIGETATCIPLVLFLHIPTM